jgi:rhomboid protease GluP
VKRQILISLNLGASHVGYFDLGRLCHDLRIEGMSNLCPEYPHVHRLVTSMFVHFGIMHFLFNIYALLQLGPLLEQVYGRSKFLVLYFLCGVGGSAVSIWWHWDNPSGAHAGASGALFGLIGASLVYGWRTGGAFGRSLASEMLRWGVFALIFSLLVRADNAAHLGGAAVGAGLALVLPDQNKPSKIHPNVWLGLEMICLLALVGSFVALFALDDPIYALFKKAWFKG